MPRAHPPEHLLSSVVDADAVPELGHALGEGDRGLQGLAERAVLGADRLRGKAEPLLGGIDQGGHFRRAGVALTAGGEDALGGRLDQGLGGADGESGVGVDTVDESAQVVMDGLLVGEGVERVLSQVRAGSAYAHSAGRLVDVEAVFAQEPDPLLAQAVFVASANRAILDERLQHVAEDCGQPLSVGGVAQVQGGEVPAHPLASLSLGCGGPRATPRSSNSASISRTDVLVSWSASSYIILGVKVPM